MNAHHIPTLLIIVPLAGAILVMALPRGREELLRWVSLAIGLLELTIAAFAYSVFDGAIYGPQMEYRRSWIAELGIEYHVGMDGVSLLLVVTTALLLITALLASWDEVQYRVKEFSATLLALAAAAVGALVALDMAMFFICTEIALLPLFLLIGVWGGDGRVFAAVKFALSNLAGSTLILAAIVYLGVLQIDLDGPRSFAFAHLAKLSLAPQAEFWLLVGMLIGFAMKAALFPLHSWLADLHRQANTASSIAVNGIWLNLGLYGILRVCLPLFSETVQQIDQYLVLLAVVATVYGGMLAWSAAELPRLLAFVSIGQVGFVTLGFASLTVSGVSGGVVHMVSRALVMTGLFVIVGILRARGLTEATGLSKKSPWTCGVLLVFTIAAVGVPGSSLFVGAFTVMAGALHHGVWYVFGAIVGLLLAAASLLRRYQQLAFGTATGDTSGNLKSRELAVLVSLLLGVLWIGLKPQTALDKIVYSIEHVLVDVDSHASAKQAGEP